jgi:hypothetical protein
METKTVYFSVDPQGVVNLARERYWFEDQKRSGVDILKCFIGIESYQITRILEGDATVNEQRRYVESSDDDFKQKLKDCLAFRKKYDEVNFMYLGGIKVERAMINEYASHIVKRLRETMRNTKYGIMFDPKDMDEILGLEYKRQELHDAILLSAGFNRKDASDEAREFKLALNNYVDSKAGTITDESIEDMSPDEMEEKRERSKKILTYMESYNLKMAKDRGLI